MNIHIMMISPLRFTKVLHWPLKTSIKKWLFTIKVIELSNKSNTLFIKQFLCRFVGITLILNIYRTDARWIQDLRIYYNKIVDVVKIEFKPSGIDGIIHKVYKPK